MVASESANAQVVFRGTVELANPTRWSSSVLQPGKYEVQVEKLLRDGSVIRVTGEGRDVIMLAGPSLSAGSSWNGKLEIVNVNGMDIVRKFDAGSLGKAFAFHVPKAARTEAAMRKNPTTEIPVDATH